MFCTSRFKDVSLGFEAGFDAVFAIDFFAVAFLPVVVMP